VLKSKWGLLFIVAVIAIGAGYFGYSLNAQSKKTESTPAIDAKLHRVGALGRLEPKGEIITLSAPTALEGARVEKLHVEEGDWVKPGQLIATLDVFGRRDTAQKEAQARVEVADAKLKQILAGAKPGEIAAQEAMVARAEGELKRTEQDLARAESLRSSGAITIEDYDLRKQLRDASRQTLRQSKEILSSLREVRAVDIKVAEIEVAAAKTTVEKMAADLDTALVKALVAGQIIKIYAQPGERVGEKGVLQMGKTDEMYPVAEVYEADVPRMKKGQSARIKVAGIDGDLQGIVERIGLQVGRKVIFNNDPVADTDARVVEVRIRLAPESSKRVAGLSNARVEAIIEAP
jgi:HlyD family secretion protein